MVERELELERKTKTARRATTMSISRRVGGVVVMVVVMAVVVGGRETTGAMHKSPTGNFAPRPASFKLTFRYF